MAIRRANPRHVRVLMALMIQEMPPTTQAIAITVSTASEETNGVAIANAPTAAVQTPAATSQPQLARACSAAASRISERELESSCVTSSIVASVFVSRSLVWIVAVVIGRLLGSW